MSPAYFVISQIWEGRARASLQNKRGVANRKKTFSPSVYFITWLSNKLILPIDVQMLPCISLKGGRYLTSPLFHPTQELFSAKSQSFTSSSHLCPFKQGQILIYLRFFFSKDTLALNISKSIAGILQMHNTYNTLLFLQTHF